MSLRFYMDHHVHSAITAGLRKRNVDCLTALEDGAQELEDDQLLHRSTELGRVLFSQDVDLLEITAEWLARGQPFAGLIFGQQMQLTIGQAIRDLSLMAGAMDSQEMQNRIERIPL